MNTVLIILDMFMATLCLYQAGKFGAVMDIDRNEGRKTDTVFHVLYWFDLFFGLYFIICVYGRGIERGLQ